MRSVKDQVPSAETDHLIGMMMKIRLVEESRRSKPDDVKGDRYVEAWVSKETGRNAKTEMFSVNGIELRQNLSVVA